MDDRVPQRPRRRLEDLEAALRRERDLLAAERRRHAQELATARRRTAGTGAAGAQKKVARLERKLSEVYASRTWKAGRAIWHVFHAPGLIAGRFRRREPASVAAKQPEAQAGDPDRTVETVGYSLVGNQVVREKYEEAIARLTFTGTAERSIAIAVYTTDLDEGRGDIYTAVGLGRNLEQHGCEVAYLPRERWYDVPNHTDTYIAMLEGLDVTQLPADVTTVAWIRNQTDSWIDQPSLGLYDLVLASSSQSLEAVERHYAGRTGILRIGVDTELFSNSGPVDGRRGVVSTVNQWGREREVNSFLASRPIEFPLALFGRQRGVGADLVPHCRGPVPFFALPSLYNEAAVVLDDFNHTTAGYGNVNSRVFEATACGAVVMTNRSIGLTEAGLDDVPVFSSGADLHELVGRYHDNEDRLKAAADRAVRIRETHSYAVRATEFLGHLDRIDGEPDARGPELVLGFFPDYRDNPFTEMLWSAMRQEGAIAIPVDNSLDFTALIRAADHRPTVFHLNWTAPILGASRDDAVVARRHRRFVEALDELAARGVPVVWTVHNVVPHECADPLREAQLRQEIADRVDVIHVMAEETVAECSGFYELPRSKIRRLPHPSYVDVYPNLVDQRTARHDLGLAYDDFVYLHFGQIRPYKGIDLLLDAFERLSSTDRKTRLLLVGEPGRFEQRDEIMQRARANPRILSNFNPIPDEDIQLYMNAADVVVLPYRRILNSGALQLAYSFAKPVVAAAVGSIPSQVDATTGITFDWTDGDHALLAAMQQARSLGPEHGRAAYERAAANHYVEIGQAFRNVITEATDRTRG